MTPLSWAADTADAIEWLGQLPDDSVDLLLTSPPYEDARTYGIAFGKVGQVWVDWMVEVVKAAAPKVKGLIAIVCEGRTRKYRYSCVPFLLMADLHRAGFNLRKPPAFHRVGIPGSGGPDWLRNDWEPIVCVTRKGKLPWSDNTACGHPPKWAPGGEMSHRQSNGARVNQWGHPIGSGATVTDEGGSVTCKGKRPSHRFAADGRTNAHGVRVVGAGNRTANGNRRATSGTANGDTINGDGYAPPVLANPGNVIACKVGGGLMGHPLAHDNEAPFPLTLAEFFVRSFCPPAGVVCDPFTGSGTTAHAAKKWGRSFIGCDVRESQVELTRRRLASVATELYV